jgi:hypothetical protein
MLLLIEQNGETIVSDKTHSILTNKWLYSREPTGEWRQKDIPPPPENERTFPPLEPEPPKEKKKKKK